MHFVSDLLGGYTLELGRVSVFLGANGVGKSRLLREIKDNPSKLGGVGKLVYIEGGRTIKIDNQLKFTPQTFQYYDRLETSEAQWSKKVTQSLADRVFDGIMVLHQRGVVINTAYANSVEAWLEAGQLGPCPVRTKPPLHKVFELFHEIFPAIKLGFDEAKRVLSAEKYGQGYGPASLSDGEKQVFSVLSDLMDLKDEFKHVVVDEPELNLHPTLAEALWSLVEGEFPEMSFIYATHSINFALRKGVNTVFILSSQSQNIVKMDNVSDIPRDDMLSFLGGIPGVLSANKVLVTEGHEKSFDAILYRWLIDDESIEVFPAGDCNQVLKISAKQGLWQNIASSISVVGIVDSDFNALASEDYSDADVLTLPVHEAESLLCDPQVIGRLAERLGCTGEELTVDATTRVIMAELQTQRLRIAARRVMADSRINLAVSVQRNVLAKIRSPDDLTACILDAGNAEVAKAVEAFGADALQNKLATELSRIDQAVASSNVGVALLLLPGKELAKRLARSMGLQHAEGLVRLIRANFKADEFSHLVPLRTEILRRLHGN